VRRWFDRLPIHRKLVVMALAVTTTALLVSTAGLAFIDFLRYVNGSKEDVDSSARLVASNLAAAVTFNDKEAARTTLDTVGAREVVTRACVYRLDGSLYVEYTRDDSISCPPELPNTPQGLRTVSGRESILFNDRIYGYVYVERDLPDLGRRIALTLFAVAVMLTLGATLAYGLSHRLQRAISRPITQLAAAARAMGRNQEFTKPAIAAPPDEVGELVQAFDEMVTRVRDANAGLLRSNELLRHEVEERKRMEAERETLLVRERQASRMKDEFLAAVSHELRTPLNAIVGWVQVLGSRPPTEETLGKALPSLSRNARALTRVIDDLIDISRVATGKMHLEFGPVDLRTVVDAAVEVTSPMARAKKVSMRAQLPGWPCLVNGDSNRLQQVVWNLLSNAVKFTPSGGTIAVALLEQEQAYAIIVSDSGIGIEPEFLPRVFERFLQADGSMTRQHGGLGLGLAIVKELTELHGGTVSASSGGQNKGARFTVCLPRLDPATTEAPPSEARRPEASWPSLAGVKILAVDDNRDALDVLSATLMRAGADVEVSVSGREAVDSWTRNPGDVLLCDLAMPDMDGFGVLRRIRALDAARHRQTPVIAVTAHAADEHLARTTAAGFQHHIAKPFDAGELVRVVAAAVGRA
jgi:signal transduction histidine kinase/CheY-like chemotaxis protein